ncbi:MAG: heavy metal-associated domain-containing protein, partial [Psychromonas sp.]
MSLSKSVTLAVYGMNCNGCASRLQTALNQIEGVHAKVSFVAKSADLRIDNSVDYEKTIKLIETL